MKRNIIPAVLIVVLAFTVQSFVTGPDPDPEGKWKFSVPEAPYGYNNGMIEISREEQTLKGKMRFDGIDYAFNCEDLIYKDFQISFLIYVEDTEALVILNFQENELDKLTGIVSYFEGEIGITAKRIPEN